MLIGASNTEVQLLWALCLCQLHGTKLLINGVTGSPGKTSDWFYAIRDWVFDPSMEINWPVPEEIEYFDGMDTVRRQLMGPTIERWFQIDFPEFCVDTMIDLMLQKKYYPTLSEYITDPTVHVPEHMGWMYQKMQASGIDSPRDQLRVTFDMALAEIREIRNLPNTQLINMYDLFDEDLCSAWAEKVLGKPLPNPSLLIEQHRAWRYHNQRTLSAFATAADLNGAAVQIDIPSTIDGNFSYQLS